jgi:protocatechuate 3,4-dioxygenase beta subunit
MNRKNFLKSIGLAGIASVIPYNKSRAGILSAGSIGADCVLIPAETAGPFPIDLSGEPEFFRVDITEGKTGVPLTLNLTVVNVNDNCNPIPNARVDVWHCDMDGYYSGFVNNGYLGTIDNTGETFCRGIQMTDSEGKVGFTSIYPGWYPGRVGHIHFEIYIGATLKATSQLAFPNDINDLVNSTSPLYTDHGINPTTNEEDGVFDSPPGDLEYELSTVTGSIDAGFTAELTIGIAVPLTSISDFEPETGGQFKLLQNTPNPFEAETTIPFTLLNSAAVMVELFDLQARKIATLLDKDLPPSEHVVLFHNRKYNLSPGNYIYQLQTINGRGTFRQCKLFTLRM